MFSLADPSHSTTINCYLSEIPTLNAPKLKGKQKDQRDGMVSTLNFIPRECARGTDYLRPDSLQILQTQTLGQSHYAY